MTVGNGTATLPLLLATVRPAWPQRRLALTLGILLLISFGIAAPFADLPLPQARAFGPAISAIIILADLTTAVLLFSQFSILRSRAVLMLAAGYLFGSLFNIAIALAYPRPDLPEGLLGAGLQTVSWLYLSYHFIFLGAVIGYTLLKDAPITQGDSAPGFTIAVTVASVVASVCALTWLFIVADSFVPRFALDTITLSTSVYYVGILLALLSVFAFLFLLTRQRSMLDLWVLIATLAFALESIMSNMLITTRFSLGFYVGLAFLVFNSAVVMFIMLTETTLLYAQLTRTNALLQRERTNKLMNLEAVADSIAHEVKQPITAIAARGGASLSFLKQTPPNIAEASTSINAMIDAGFRVNATINNIRALFKQGDASDQLDINELALSVLQEMDSEVKANGVETKLDLTDDLPTISGHRGQLDEVLANLIRNAIEAMEPVSGRRLMSISTEANGRDGVAITIKDTGPGLHPELIESVFEAFFTTKTTGMGLGLAICRTIIERHGGEIFASSVEPQGAVFRIVLPKGS